MKFQFLPENFSRSENAPPFETRKIRQFEVERIFLENKKMVQVFRDKRDRGEKQNFYEENNAYWSRRAGRPPDLFDGRRQCRGGKFRLLWCAAGSGGDMQAAAASFPVVGAGGPGALQTSSMGEDSAEAGNSDFCSA